MSVPNTFADLTPSAERLIIRGAYDIVAADQGAVNMHQRGGIHLMEGPQPYKSMVAGALYISGRTVAPKEWPSQRASVFCDVFLSAALGAENFQSSILSPLVATDLFNYYRCLFSNNLSIPAGGGKVVNLPILDFSMVWVPLPPEVTQFKIADMRFRFQTDIDPRDGSIIYGG